MGTITLDCTSLSESLSPYCYLQCCNVMWYQDAIRRNEYGCRICHLQMRWGIDIVGLVSSGKIPGVYYLRSLVWPRASRFCSKCPASEPLECRQCHELTPRASWVWTTTQLSASFLQAIVAGGCWIHKAMRRSASLSSPYTILRVHMSAINSVLQELRSLWEYCQQLQQRPFITIPQVQLC